MERSISRSNTPLAAWTAGSHGPPDDATGGFLSPRKWYPTSPPPTSFPSGCVRSVVFLHNTLQATWLSDGHQAVNSPLWAGLRPVPTSPTEVSSFLSFQAPAWERLSAELCFANARRYRQTDCAISLQRFQETRGQCLPTRLEFGNERRTRFDTDREERHVRQSPEDELFDDDVI